MNEYTFDYVERNRLDAFCKTVLRNEAINYLSELARRRDREKPLDTLPQAEMDKLCTLDEYPSDSFVFSAFGYDLHIRDEQVAGAFATLPEQEQQILILHCVAAMADGEIGGLMPAIVSYWAITFMSFTAMGASTLFMVQIYTLVQTQTPPQLVGKIMAALISIAMCGQPIGQAIYGVLFDIFAAHTWVVLIGAAIAAFLISLYSKKIFGRLENSK